METNNCRTVSALKFHFEAMFSDMWSALESYAAAIVVAVIAVAAALKGETVMEFAAFAGLAFAAVVGVKALQTMKYMETMMEVVVQKCTYMEARMDKGAGRVQDVCRHMSQTFADFEEKVNFGHTLKEKWWWVCRRVRDTYEDFTGALMQKGLQYKAMTGAWSLVCLEVYLRCCRDIAAIRFAAMSGEEIDEDEKAGLENALKNFAVVAECAELCSFWVPLEMELLEAFEPSSGVETVLKYQTMERIAELQQYAATCSDGVKLFEGMNLKKIGIGAAGSSAN